MGDRLSNKTTTITTAITYYGLLLNNTISYIICENTEIPIHVYISNLLSKYNLRIQIECVCPQGKPDCRLQRSNLLRYIRTNIHQNLQKNKRIKE